MDDKFGCPVAGPPAAVAGVVGYQLCVLAYKRFEAWGAILNVADAHSDSVMAQCLAADFLQQQAGGAGPAGNKRLDAAEQILAADGSAPKREAGYLAALRATATGDFAGAYAAWLAVVHAFPADLFAVKRGQFTCIMTGRSAELLEIAQAAQPLADAAAAASAASLGRYYDGLLAFGLEQTGDLEGAERAARRGLELEAAAAAALPEGGPHFEADGWLQHGLAHALYFQDKPSEAIAFLSARSGSWKREAWHPFLYTHLWWHLALLHAENGDAPAAMAIYDSQLWSGDDEGEMEVQLNAIGLLVRLHVRRVPGLAARWEAVLDGIERSGPKDYIHAYPLHNLLRLVALCVVGRETQPLIDGLRDAAAAAASTNAALGELVLPLALAIVRLVRDGDESAKRDILDLKGGENCWAAVAGSEEQRGFLLELAAGRVKSGRVEAAMDASHMSAESGSPM
jgi:hypothetical protein